jgi:hypothetical protein
VADESFLSDDLLRQLVAVGHVDVLVGIPTLNNATTVSASCGCSCIFCCSGSLVNLVSHH